MSFMFWFFWSFGFWLLKSFHLIELLEYSFLSMGNCFSNCLQVRQLTNSTDYILDTVRLSTEVEVQVRHINFIFLAFCFCNAFWKTNKWWACSLWPSLNHLSDFVLSSHFFRKVGEPARMWDMNLVNMTSSCACILYISCFLQA